MRMGANSKKAFSFLGVDMEKYFISGCYCIGVPKPLFYSEAARQDVPITHIN